MRAILKNVYYRVRKKIFRIIIKHFEYNNLLFGNDLNSEESKFGRDAFDLNVRSMLRALTKRKDTEPSVSAIFRVKNGEEYIESAILSVSPLASEIVVIDNQSTDETKSIVYRLKKQLVDVVNISYHYYPDEVELAGSGYLERVKSNPSRSLAKFYTYCFSLGTCDYLMKCDAHVVFTPQGIKAIRDALVSRPKNIRFTGMEIFGKSLNYEPSLFKNDDNYKFVDLDEWEKLLFEDDNGTLIDTPVFIHLKRLSYIKGILSETPPAKFKYMG